MDGCGHGDTVSASWPRVREWDSFDLAERESAQDGKTPFSVAVLIRVFHPEDITHAQSSGQLRGHVFIGGPSMMAVDFLQGNNLGVLQHMMTRERLSNILDPFFGGPFRL